MISNTKRQGLKGSSTGGSMIELRDEDLTALEGDESSPTPDFEIDLIEVEEGAASNIVRAVPIFATLSMKAQKPPLGALTIEALGRSFMGRPTDKLARTDTLIIRPELERSHMFQRPATFAQNPGLVTRWLQSLEGHQGVGRLSFLDLGIWFKVCDAQLQSGPLRHARLAFEVGDGAPVQALIRALGGDASAELSDLNAIAQRSPDLILRWISTALLALTCWTNKAPILLNYGVSSCDPLSMRWSTSDICLQWAPSPHPHAPPLLQPSQSDVAPTTSPAAPSPAAPSPAAPSPTPLEGLFQALTPQAQLSVRWLNGHLHDISGSADASALAEAQEIAESVAPSSQDIHSGLPALFSPERAMIWVTEGAFWLGLFTPHWVGMLRLPNAKMGIVFAQLKGR